MNAQDINELRISAVEEIRQASNATDLESLRIKYIGRKGKVQEILPALKDAAPADKPAMGQAINLLKKEIQEAIALSTQAIESNDQGPSEDFDLTLPGEWNKRGSHHPVSQIIDRVTDIFRSIGFTVAEGPDIESVHYNFDALNTPDDHPSRDEQDTFYLDNGLLLRTQTSPVQIRYMEKNKPPIRIVSPGRCYRRDTPDATHSANFHQIEGLYIGENVSLTDLKSDLSYFAQQILGPKAKVRFRPHFFPFTEPSVEVDFYCDLGKTKGWLEIAGAGIVDPNVLEAVGYNPEEVSGYAFGMGIERIAMILYEIDDIRLIYENNANFLAQA